MNWYYVEAGQQAGPVDEATLDEMVRTGRLPPDTLVWREGMVNWAPYREVKPIAPAPGSEPPILAPPPVASMLVSDRLMCCECGHSFGPDEVIRFGDRYVCATCKPIFVQRLTEGAPLAPPVRGYVTEQQLLAREYRIDIDECLTRAWALFKANPGLIIGTTLVIGLVWVAVYGVGALLGMVVPLADMAVQMVFTGPIVGGFMWFFLRQARGEPAVLGDAFEGFRSRFVQLMLSSLVQNLLNLACMVPAGLVLVLFGLTAGFGGQPALQQAGAGLVALFIVCAVMAAAGIVYLNTLWTFSLPLVVDKRMDFWPAMQLSRRMVSKRWWMTLLFWIVAGVIFVLGMLACGVGLLVTAPLFYGMVIYLYEDNFHDLAAQAQ